MRRTGLWAWVFAVATGLAGGAARGDDSDVIARCGGIAIRRADLERVIRRLGASEMVAGPQRQRAEAAILEQLVDDRILRLELQRRGFQVTDAEIDAAVARLREQMAGRGVDFDAFLTASGRSAEGLGEQVALEIALEKFVRPQITAESIAETFEKRRREFDGTQLRVSHVVLRPEAGGDGDLAAGLLERASRIRTDIIQGKVSFAAAARIHSAGPSRREGGDIGWIARDGPFVEAFSSQAYSLAKGSVSPPFVTPYGVHIVTVTGIQPGRIGIDAVRPRLEKLLAAQLVRALVAAGRRETEVSFAPGVPHLDAASVGRPVDERAVVIGDGS